ncbi:MAG: cupin domain-containing protein [Candidatus Methylacidiphilales bacterium]|nr:cupin domain-containing protein [Candidatus Methylacidiphilales bacterium]
MSLQPLINKAADRRNGNRTAFCLAAGAATGGGFTLYEETVPPGSGPPMHVHTREDEGFYILAGEVTIIMGDATHVLHTGDFLFAPRDIPHRFFNSGAVPATFLVMISPAGFENFLAEYAVLMAKDPTNMVPVVDLGERYGLRFL